MKKEKEKYKPEKKKHRKKEKEEMDPLSRNRDEYEETNGTVTQELEEKLEVPEFLTYTRLLAEDSAVRMVSNQVL